LVVFGTGCGSTDFQRLAVDANGVYIEVLFKKNCGREKVAALPKGPFTNGTASAVQTDFILDAGVAGRRYPALNTDAIAATDPVFFLGAGGILSPRSIFLNKLRWANGFSQCPQWDQVWPGAELPITTTYALPMWMAPQLGSTASV